MALSRLTSPVALRRRPASRQSDRMRLRSAWVSMTVMLSVVLATLAVAVSAGPARAAATTVNLDQWASTAFQWQNGNLNGTNSRYPEGGVVPFRLAIEGLAAGDHVIHINYDFTAGGHKAYDFLATWNVTNAAGRICTPTGGAISSMCPSLPTPTTASFPSDPYVTDGLSVAGAERYSGTPRRLTVWGGTILSITGPTHAGPSAGNSSADITVRFRNTGPAVLFAWGGHLGQSSYWNRANGGPADGASQVSGSPWHMRTLNLDGTGNKNQDRSISPSAIVGELPPGALTPSTPTPATPTPSTPTPAPTRRVTSPTSPPSSPVTAAGVPDRPVLTVPPTSTGHGSPVLEPAPSGGALLLILGSLLATCLAAASLRCRIRRRA
jgi:hypothetical protein